MAANISQNDKFGDVPVQKYDSWLRHGPGRFDFLKSYAVQKKTKDLDHTADVQLYSWGSDLKEAFEQCAIAMFGYMTEIDTVDMLEEETIEAEGHDIESLLFHFLDEWLFVFSADPFFIARKVVITEFNEAEFKIKAVGYGEVFDLDKHPQGTEVKAITYSNMQIHTGKDRDKHELYVIIDI